MYVMYCKLSVSVTQSLSKITQLEDELRVREDEHNAIVISTITEAENKYRSTLEESSALSAEIRNLKVRVVFW